MGRTAGYHRPALSGQFWRYIGLMTAGRGGSYEFGPEFPGSILVLGVELTGGERAGCVFALEVLAPVARGPSGGGDEDHPPARLGRASRGAAVAGSAAR